MFKNICIHRASDLYICPNLLRLAVFSLIFKNLKTILKVSKSMQYNFNYQI